MIVETLDSFIRHGSGLFTSRHRKKRTTNRYKLNLVLQCDVGAIIL